MKLTQLIKWLPSLVLAALVLAACGGDEPEHDRDDFEVSETMYTVEFNNPDDFEVGRFGDGSSLTIEDDQYLIRSSNSTGNSFLFGSTTDRYPALRNVMIEVEATTQAGSEDNWFGVMCRVDDENRGYVLLISADGFWAIGNSTGRGLDFFDNWRETDVINTGRGATNHLRVYCVNDYLALYVNGEFVGEHSDSSITEAGAVGLLAGGPRETPSTVAFDDLVFQPVSREGEVPEQPAATLELAPLDDLAPPADDGNRVFGG